MKQLDTEQDRRFFKRLCTIFTEIDPEAQKKAEESRDEFSKGINDIFKDVDFGNLPKISESYNHLIKVEEETGLHIPAVTFLENFLEESANDEESIKLKNFYFKVKKKYIEYENSEDINNF